MTASTTRANRPIFVFGSPRSGTSLTSRILNAHSNIGVPFESLIYHVFYPVRGAYGDLESPGNAERLVRHILRWRPMREWTPALEFEGVLHHLRRRTFHGVFEAILDSWAESAGKKRWGEKSPWHAYFWREILAGFPDALFLHVVRDPRDATLSWKRARQGPRNAYVLARRWAQYIDVIGQLEESVSADAVHEVRYERLIADPRSEAEALCRFLDEPFEEAMLDFHLEKSAYPTDSTNRTNLSRPILGNNAGRWRDGLAETEVRWVEAAAGRQMVSAGYSPSGAPRPIGLAEKAWIGGVANPLSRIVGMVKDRQGQMEGLQKKWLPIAARLGRLRPDTSDRAGDSPQ